jgi:hypothetical protein
MALFKNRAKINYFNFKKKKKKKLNFLTSKDRLLTKKIDYY